MAMTGGLAANGKSALLAQKIWEEDVNAKGGLLGRPVKLVYYDDQSNPATVPGIYTKLLDVDKVDLVIGPYATAQIAPAMPIVIQRGKLFIGLLGLAVNSEFNYPNYFAMIPSGPDPKPSFTKGFFDTAMAQTPKPQTVAIVAADQEFSRNAVGRRPRERQEGGPEDRLRQDLSALDHRLRPDRARDPGDQSRSRGAVLLSAGFGRHGAAVNEIGFKPKMIGGAMVGLQATALKTQLGPALNGFVNYDFWLPVPKMMFPGVEELIKKYQARAPAEGVDLARLLHGAVGLRPAPGAGRRRSRRRRASRTRSSPTTSAPTASRPCSATSRSARTANGRSRACCRSSSTTSRATTSSSSAPWAPRPCSRPSDYNSGNVIFPFEKAK